MGHGGHGPRPIEPSHLTKTPPTTKSPSSGRSDSSARRLSQNTPPLLRRHALPGAEVTEPKRPQDPCKLQVRLGPLLFGLP
jgi:hypothetical protein